MSSIIVNTSHVPTVAQYTFWEVFLFDRPKHRTEFYRGWCRLLLGGIHVVLLSKDYDVLAVWGCIVERRDCGFAVPRNERDDGSGRMAF